MYKRRDRWRQRRRRRRDHLEIYGKILENPTQHEHVIYVYIQRICVCATDDAPALYDFGWVLTRSHSRASTLYKIEHVRNKWGSLAVTRRQSEVSRTGFCVMSSLLSSPFFFFFFLASSSTSYSRIDCDSFSAVNVLRSLTIFYPHQNQILF